MRIPCRNLVDRISGGEDTIDGVVRDSSTDSTGKDLERLDLVEVEVKRRALG